MRAKKKTYYECRCDERLKTKDEESTLLTYNIHWVDRGTGTPKDKDEKFVNVMGECVI